MAEQIKLDVDLEQLARNVRQVKDSLVALGDEGAAAFKQVAGAAAAAGNTVDQAFDIGVAEGMADALNDLQKEYKQLEASANTLRGALRRATDPDAIELYSKSIAKLEAGMKQLETAGNKAGVAVKGYSKEASTASEVTENFVGQLSKAALITAAISAVAQFTKEAFNLARQVAKTERQFAGFVGGINNARTAIAGFNATARKVKIPEREFQQAAKSLLGFGFSVKETDAALRNVADVARGSGKDFNELALIYGKARAAGVLYAEDLNQLSEAGIPIITQLSKQLGVQELQIKKLASEGKIGFGELELAFRSLTSAGGLYAGQARANADATDELAASWERLKTKAGQVLAPSINFVVGALNDLLTSLGAVTTEKGFGGFIRSLDDAGSALLNSTFLPGIKGLKDSVNDFLFGIKSEDNTVKVIDPFAQFDEAGLGGKKPFNQLTEQEKKLMAERAKLRADAAKKEAAKRAKEAAQYERERQQAVIDAMAEGEAKELAIEQQRFNACFSMPLFFEVSDGFAGCYRVKIIYYQNLPEETALQIR